MRRIFTLIVSILLPMAGYSQLYVEPVKDVEATIFIPKQRYARAQQGLEIYKDYIFSIEDGGHVNVYDFKSAIPEPIAMFELASSQKDNHANNASFGITTLKGASFPLLYISVGKPGADIDWTCFVESITRKGKKFTTELVQKIVLDPKGWEDKGYVSIFGAPSFMVDAKRGDLWVLSARKRTTPKVTLNNWENQYIVTKFRVPEISEGPVVTLTAEDILEQVVLPYDTGFTQAGDVYDGMLYYGFGVGDDEKRPSRIRIYDLDNRVIAARYNIRKEIPIEIEDIKLYKEYIYVNTNTNPNRTKTPPSIYKVALPKPAPVPTDPIEELRQSPEKAGGVYYVTDLAAEQVTPAPRGYKPFYITGYFRHGARQIDEEVTYPRVFGCLESAHDADNLTDFGKEMYKRFAGMKQNMYWREGDLTQIGYRQTLELGRRMVDNYPEVFEGEPYLKANATNVLRVSSSMQSVVQGITSRVPDAEWVEIRNSRSLLKKLNQYGTKCPDKLPIDVKFYGHDSPWYKNYSAFRQERINPDDFLSRMFKNIDLVKAEYESYDLVWRFWLVACVQQCLDRKVPVWDMFTEEEILNWAEVENYRYYSQKSKDPALLGRGWGLGSRTLRYILESADKNIRAGHNGADLNFGHDGTVMSILVNLDADDWGKSVNDPNDVLDIWQYWDIPMGSNIQFVFYRNERTEDVLVKVMLNEKDLNINPLKPVKNNFYRWDEFLKYYISHCDKVEEMLKETENME